MTWSTASKKTECSRELCILKMKRRTVAALCVCAYIYVCVFMHAWQASLQSNPTPGSIDLIRTRACSTAAPSGSPAPPRASALRTAVASSVNATADTLQKTEVNSATGATPGARSRPWGRRSAASSERVGCWGRRCSFPPPRPWAPCVFVVDSAVAAAGRCRCCCSSSPVSSPSAERPDMATTALLATWGGDSGIVGGGPTSGRRLLILLCRAPGLSSPRGVPSSSQARCFVRLKREWVD